MAWGTSDTTTRSLTANNASALTGTITNDVALANGPEDSISSIRWSPQANHLAVASWDSKIRIYDCTQNTSGVGVAMIEFEKPVLSCDWSKDGQKVVGAALDQTARLLDLGSGGGVAQQVAAHDMPIKSARFFDAPGAAAQMLVTGSWDKTIKYWDLRQATPVGTVTCSERVYSMDVKASLLTAATADRQMHIIDLNNPATIQTSSESKLAHQTRVVTCMADGKGYAYGSVEGRCAISYIQSQDQSMNMTFRCHRETETTGTQTKIDIYAVNDVQFHPVYSETFSTAGSDGIFHFWDRKAKSRLRSFPSVGGSITSTAFSGDGTVFAYAVSYDWSKGYSANRVDYPTKIMLHKVLNEEVKPKGAGR